MLKKTRKLFLYVTSFAFVALMGSFYFFGVFQTILFFTISNSLLDRAMDRSLGPDKKIVRIDGAKFKIPEEYVSIASKAKGEYQNAVTLRLEYIWPELTPVRLAEGGDYKTAKQQKRNAYLNVGKAWPDKVDKHLSLKPNEDGIVKNEFAGQEYGFDKYKYYSVDRETGDLKSRSASYILRDENQNITDHLNCYYPYPPDSRLSCNYYFLDKSLLYHVRFWDVPSSETWLQWKIRNIDFINQYRVN